jgi:hypothetical protein
VPSANRLSDKNQMRAGTKNCMHNFVDRRAVAARAPASLRAGRAGMAQDKKPNEKTASADHSRDTAHKQSRMEEIVRVIEEYANGQRELLKALRKKFFH